jgi:hypothetical protein
LEPGPDDVELFVGCYVQNDGRIAIYGPGGSRTLIDSKTMVTSNGETGPVNPQLKQALLSVMKKLSQESQKDITSNLLERKSLIADQAATQRDLDEYMSIQTQFGYDPSYEVDYGTDSIPVAQAIDKTRQDLNSVLFDQAALDSEIQKSQLEYRRFQATLENWSS